MYVGVQIYMTMITDDDHWVPSRGRSESAALGVCVSLYTHTLRVLPIHYGRETVPSDDDGDYCSPSKHGTSIQCWTNAGPTS